MATIGVLSERAVRHGEILSAQPQTALDSHVIIEQAKGVIAQQFGVSMDTAFTRLRRYSRHDNLRLAEVARQCVAGGLTSTWCPRLPRQGKRRAPQHAGLLGSESWGGPQIWMVDVGACAG